MTRRAKIVDAVVIVAAMCAVAFGVVWMVVSHDRHVAAEHRHAVERTDAAIKACGDNGGHYLYGSRQLIRLEWKYAPRQRILHEDFVVTMVPWTGGGMCLTPVHNLLNK